MKKLFATLLLVGSTYALAACETASTSNTYAVPRTASYSDASTPVAPAEEVFQKAQNK